MEEKLAAYETALLFLADKIGPNAKAHVTQLLTPTTPDAPASEAAKN